MSVIVNGYPFALGASSSGGGGGGGGGGGTPTQVQASGTADETIAAGDVVRLARNGEAGLTAGRIVKATASTVNGSEVIGIASSSASQGGALTFIVAGAAPTKFGSAPATTTNGSIVYLDTTIGQASLTAPSGAGTSIVRIGKVFGANGIATTPDIILNIQTPILQG